MNRVKRNWVSVKRGTGWGLKSYVQLKSRMGTGNRKENIVLVEKVFLLSQNSRDPNAGSKMTHSVCV